MQFETMKLDPRIARVHYADYRARCAKNREARKTRMTAEINSWNKHEAAKLTQLEQEDTELLRAYKALCKGERLVNVVTAVRAAGFDAKLKLPKLAICRADYEKVVFYTGGNAYTSPLPYKPLHKKDKPSIIPTAAYAAEITNAEWRKNQNLPRQATALVPSVPAALRPDDLSKYYILWEAEWDAKAPVDPLLLSRVNTTMFAVVAQWDLTPLEQSILEGRL
jgi:hypothetical protein